MFGFRRTFGRLITPDHLLDLASKSRIDIEHAVAVKKPPRGGVDDLPENS
jgi:hypothetical protein